MVELLVFTSGISVFLGLLVLRAYVMHVRRREWDNPVIWLALGFVVLNAAWVCRTMYWDIIWWWMGNTPSDPNINVWLNIAVISSQLCALRARLLTIPMPDRASRNIITAAWYPSDLISFRRKS